MIPLTSYLSIVEKYAPPFRGVFSEEEHAQFCRYLSGLITGVNKTVEGINRLFILDLQHPVTLNRFLTNSHFDAGTLNRVRLDWLQQCPEMRFDKPPGQGKGSPAKGVLILDDTLLTHYGEHFEKAAYLYDHVNGSHAWARQLVNLHYSDDLTDYPVDFLFWEQADLGEVERALREMGCVFTEEKLRLKDEDPKRWRRYLMKRYDRKKAAPLKGKVLEKVHRSLTDLAIELLDGFVARHPHVDLPVAFDGRYTSKELCGHIDRALGKKYVGTVFKDNHVLKGGGEVTLEALTEGLKKEHLRATGQKGKALFEKVGIRYKGGKEAYYAHCGTYHVKGFGRQRLVISFREEDLSDKEPKYYISNCLHWRSSGILRIRRHRWPIEVYHEEAKAEGLDKYQVRSFGAVEKHTACICVAYSMLKRAQFDKDFLDGLHWRPKQTTRSLAFWRRVMAANGLLGLMLWANQGSPLPEGFTEKIASAFL